MPGPDSVVYQAGVAHGRTEAAAEIERLRAALEPFARDNVQPYHATPDDAAMVAVLDDEHRPGSLTAADFRRARAALHGTDDDR